MLLYESLQQGPPCNWESSGMIGPMDLTTRLRDTVLVRVDNVARYYAESPQDFWVLNRDFPCMASPWPDAFYEWTATGSLNHDGVIEQTNTAGVRAGVLISQAPLADVRAHPDGLEVTAALITYSAFSRHAPSQTVAAELGLRAFWRELPDDRRAEYMAQAEASIAAIAALGGTWACMAWAFVQRPREPAIVIEQFLYWLDDQGAVVASPHGDGVALAVCVARMDPAHFQEMMANQAQSLHVPALAMSFAHCKNVRITDTVPPPKLSAAQVRRHGVPKATFKTLEILPMATLTRAEERRSGSTAGRALHIMRGHFKDYRAGGGLFGKYQGRYWWPMRVRGQADAGIVVKDYAIAGGGE